jgi:type I restriction enzyme S subunit
MTVRPYQRYADTGIEWLGEVPSHWGTGRVKTTTYLKGRVGWKGLTSEEYLEDGHAYLVTGTDFKDKFIDWQNCHCIDEDRYQDDPFIQLMDGDLLITKDGTVGKLALVKGLDRPACLNSGIFVIRPERDIYVSTFMYWVLRSKSFKTFCDLSTFGSTIMHLYQNVFERFTFPLPPRTEQAAITAFLDRETAKIDALIAEQERLIVLLREKRQAVISDAVAKGLNPNAPMKDSGVEWLGEVPMHWEVRRIKQMARMESGHTPDRKVAAYWVDCTIPWVSLHDTSYLKDHDYISETAQYVNELGLANSSARLLPENAVVFSRDATIGRCAITTRPMSVSQHFIAWICSEIIIPEFLLFCLRSMGDELEKLTSGATLKTIGMPDVRTLTIGLPPLEEQMEAVSHIRHCLAKLDEMSQAAEQASLLLAERRVSLISAAITGKIDVRSFVTEPAEAA